MSDSKSQSTTQQQQTTTTTTTTDAKKSSSTAAASATAAASTTKPKSSTAPAKALAVLAKAEIGRMVDLGLGRGVDATDPKPWINKSSFQVRRVGIDNVIGTEEGGSLQSYEREVTSVHTHQTDLKTSIAIPQAPVNIGIDAEQSRSVSTTRRAVGKKVINRTISFRDDFEDAPQTRTTDPEKARAHASYAASTALSDSDEHASDTQDDGITFEERLAIWIMSRVKIEVDMKGIDVEHEKLSIPSHTHGKLPGVDAIAELAYIIDKADDELRRVIIRSCVDFVYNFRITHYVSAIELGAAEYRVLSEQEYFTKVGAAGGLGLDAIANIAVTETASWRRTKKASDLKRIGAITSDKVARGTYDEAVVGVYLRPISTLVKLRYVQLALKKALLTYVDDQGDTSSGPFLISCCNDKIFWTVNVDRNYAVEGTRNIRNASLFYITPNDEGVNPYEFSISYYGDNRRVIRRDVSRLTPMSKQVIQPIARYLDANVGVRGSNPGPLHLKFHLRHSHSRLTLNNRLFKGSAPVDTAAWVNGREVFFINCARRRMKRDGYICMKLNQNRGREELFTACVHSTSAHNDRNVFMIFRLLPASFRDNEEAKLEDTDRSIDDELKEYEGGAGRPESSGDRSREVRFAEPPGDRVHLLEPSPPRRRRVDTSGGSIPPVGEPIVMSEVGRRPVSDTTDTTVTTDTIL